MAMNHIAIARMATQKAAALQAAQQQDLEDHPEKLKVSTSSNSVVNDLGVISVASEFDESTSRPDSSRQQKSSVSGTTSSSAASNSTATSAKKSLIESPPKPILGKLDQLKKLSDVDSCVDKDLNHLKVLNNIERKWKDISTNLETVVDHLQECSDQINLASINCLKSLSDSIDVTCDNVDNEMKALYHLITKCEELTTKLSVATTFRDEIKTLKKSVETLENLYKC